MFTKKKPIFIFGSPRSGTSLVRELLNRHPNLYVIRPETCFVNWAAKLWKKGKKNPNLAIPILLRKFSEVGLEIKEPNIELFQEKSGANSSLAQTIDFLIQQNFKQSHYRWVEKSPFHVWYLDILYQLFPESTFVHCIRDGRDCVASMQNMALKSGISGWGLSGNAALWKYSIRKGLLFSKRIPQQSILHLRYEEMVTKTAETIEKICDFLEEENYVENMLNLRYQNSSYGCGKYPINSKSVGAWKQAFTENESDLVQYIIEPELKLLGYIDDSAKFNLALDQKIWATTVYQSYRLKKETKRAIIKLNYKII